MKRWLSLMPLLPTSMLLAACASASPPVPSTMQTPTAAPAPATSMLMQEMTPVSQARETSTASSEPTTTAPAEAEPATQLSSVTYRIDNTRSEASFEMREELFGQPTIVKGVTGKVEGSIIADWSNPSKSRLSVIEIDAADLRTDNERRNGAIRRFILQSEQYPKIVFEPTDMLDMSSEPVRVGSKLQFKISGKLTVRNITRSVTFDITVNADSEREISGTAETVVRWRDFELSIPNVPGVANVSEEAKLKLDFVAVKQ